MSNAIDREKVLALIDDTARHYYGLHDGPSQNFCQTLRNISSAISALPALPQEGEGMSAADARQIRLAVSAWLEGRRDGDFWMKHIHVTLGSPTSAALKQEGQG